MKTDSELQRDVMDELKYEPTVGDNLKGSKSNGGGSHQ